MIEIQKEDNKVFRFNLKTSSGRVLLESVPFTAPAEIEETIAEISPIIHNQRIFERKTHHNGKFLFALKNKEGKIIGNSQFYSSEAGMENGIKNLRNRITALSNLKTL